MIIELFHLISSFQYTIYNIGNSVATNVVVSDSSFPPEAFEIQGGQFKFVIDRVPPQTNVTHVVIVQPKSYGAFNFSFAEVTYKASENAEDVSIWYLLQYLFNIGVLLYCFYINRLCENTTYVISGIFKVSQVSVDF